MSIFNLTRHSRRFLLKSFAAFGAWAAWAQGVRAASDIGVIVTPRGEHIDTPEELAGLRICGSTRAKRLEERLERLGATIMRVPSSEAPLAYERGICDALWLAGDNRDELLKGLEVILGGKENFEAYFIYE